MKWLINTQFQFLTELINCKLSGPHLVRQANNQTTLYSSRILGVAVPFNSILMNGHEEIYCSYQDMGSYGILSEDCKVL